MKEEELREELRRAAQGPDWKFVDTIARLLAPLITAQEEKDEPPYPAKQIIDLLKQEQNEVAKQRDEALARVKELEAKARCWEKLAWDVDQWLRETFGPGKDTKVPAIAAIRKALGVE